MTDTAAMEDIHGVDVSWLHHSKRGITPILVATTPNKKSRQKRSKAMLTVTKTETFVCIQRHLQDLRKIRRHGLPL